MDLYGSGASIAQANAQSEAARQINESTRDFNNSLAEQLDQSNLEQDEDRNSKLSKNILSGVTSGGKLVSKRQALKEGAKLGFKEVKTSLSERMARESELTSEIPNIEETQRIYATGARPPSPELGVESTLREGEQATAAIEDLGGSVETGAEARAALKEGAEETGKFLGRAAKVGKIGVAGLGGGIDAFQDVGRLVSGEKGLDVFGSNTASRVGNIGNILGSTLEVAGVATGGVTPWSLALETAGAGISLLSSVTEAGGELAAGEKSKETAEKDITSQKRGQVVTEGVEQVVGRTQ